MLPSEQNREQPGVLECVLTFVRRPEIDRKNVVQYNNWFRGSGHAGTGALWSEVIAGVQTRHGISLLFFFLVMDDKSS